MKAYKGFNTDMTCRGFKFEEGKTYEEENAEMCNSGFHACEDAIDCLAYYTPNSSVYHEVEMEEVSAKIDNDSKRVAKRITIGAKLSLSQLIKASIDFRFSKVKFEKGATGDSGAASATGDRGAASATGDSGAASATGYRGAASATGYGGAASATGDRGAASATGDRGAASATGYSGAASATGYRGAASATGDRGAASATGDRGAASATGDSGAASATGYSGVASATGDSGAASATGKDSIALAGGKDCRAMGALGCWLVLAERGEWDGKKYPIIEIKTIKVDGKEILPNHWYSLRNGAIIDVTEEYD